MKKYKDSKKQKCIKCVIDEKQVITSSCKENHPPIILDPKRFLGHNPDIIKK